MEGGSRMEQKNTGYYLTADFSRRVSICKVWFTIMVLFIHSYTKTVFMNSGNVVLQVPRWLGLVKYVISENISRCAVPGFFVIAAVLLYRKEFS
jgi:surface polysaccharide O-acyltransferase-like enzyme